MSQDKALSVSEINKKIGSWIQSNSELRSNWVKGEISNFVISSTGHFYFSLKDPSSSIRCTFFLGRNQAYKGRPLKDGMEIIALGDINVYEPRGDYSLNIQKVVELGSGDIYIQVEKLKRHLQAKGIFEPEHKRNLPTLPKTLGIATSPNGAAIEDIIRIATTNYPNINILVAPCFVQGKEAPTSIVKAIELLNDPRWGVDVIIAGRGGGNYEDLMAFNEEIVVMAFYNSRIPIISAVGHEVDKVLSDYSADRSAPTPTAAAKLAVPNVQDFFDRIDDLNRRMANSCLLNIHHKFERLKKLQSRRSLTDPNHYIEERYLQLDELITKVIWISKSHISLTKEKISKLDRISFRLEQNIERKKNRLNLGSERIENFSPLSTLKRGYSIVRKKNKRLVYSSKDVGIGENIEILLGQGRLEANITLLE